MHIIEIHVSLSIQACRQGCRGQSSLLLSGKNRNSELSIVTGSTTPKQAATEHIEIKREREREMQTYIDMERYRWTSICTDAYMHLYRDIQLDTYIDTFVIYPEIMEE